MSIDGQTFRLPRFSVGVVGISCSGLTTIDFDALTVTVTGSTLKGTGSGSAQISCGDCQFAVPFAATVAGVADVTPPALVAASDAIPTDPLQPFAVIATEPLPATATARLMASDGSHVDLVPMLTDGDPPLVVGFSKPDVVLPYGNGFVVTLDGLVDFAGLRGDPAVPLRLTTFGTPPLVPGDGFESTTAATVGGATVISDGPLAPITGTRSVYIGSAGAPSPTGAPVSTALRVRLAVQAGDTKLRFSYRSVLGRFLTARPSAATVALGSVGHKPTSLTASPATEGGQTMLMAGPNNLIVFIWARRRDQGDRAAVRHHRRARGLDRPDQLRVRRPLTASVGPAHRRPGASSTRAARHSTRRIHVLRWPVSGTPTSSG